MGTDKDKGQRIIPNLWFSRNAEEAVNFYRDAFPGLTVGRTDYYPEDNLPDFQRSFAGKVLTIAFAIDGFQFLAINAGDEFRPNPSLSFFVNFDPSRDPDARAELDRVHKRLMEGGSELMPLGEYPFSPHYAWIEDRYGVSWQLILTNPDGEERPFIVPDLMFGNINQGKARAAIDFYTQLFDGRAGSVVTYPPGAGAVAGEVMFADFTLLGTWFAAMDSAGHDFTFTCGVSLMVECADQEEIDRYWDALSAVPEAEACGWCQDQFGVCWQIVPADQERLMEIPGAFQRLLEMKKIDIEALRG